MKDCPCRNCEKRFSGCHSKCEDYQKFDQKCKDLRLRRQQENSAYYNKYYR